jgi:hypothetical protein
LLEFAGQKFPRDFLGYFELLAVFQNFIIYFTVSGGTTDDI